ncbi:CBS domain-containing protein [Oxalobacteraceae bacterium OM1]|nr:CBS domain-containing protein [Oxalobacteraceae bacterium OM1]
MQTDSVLQIERRDYTADRRILAITAMAACIGGCSTVAAVVLLNLIRFFTNLFFFQRFSLADAMPAQHTLGAWVILLPVLGGLIVGAMARYGSEKIRGHGIPEAIEAILFGKSKMSPKVAVLKPLSSGIVIGSGGPFGAEGPIIMTGGSLGSLIAQFFHLTGAERKTLLVAGACAGMTAVFGTPAAAVLLAVELMLFELRPRSLLPVAVACGVAGFLRMVVLDAAPLFPLQTAPATLPALGSCLVAGLLCGVLSAVLTQALYRIEDLFAHLPVHWMWWPAIGGLAVGIGGWLQPRALGVGYDVINDLLHNQMALQVALALLAAKAVMWAVALGSGTSGGVLAPLLMMGAGLGVALGPWLPGGEPSLWALVCMAAVLGAVLGAPLTAVVFAFGLTHDSAALLPLLLTTAVAYGFTVLTMPRSIMTEKIARRGLHIYREYSVDPLERQHVADRMTRKVLSIDAAMPAGLALQEYFGPDQLHRAYPLLRDGRLVGMVERGTLLAMEEADLPCANLVEEAPVVALAGESLRMVAARMAAHGIERLPVVDNEQDMQLIGLISRSDILQATQQVFNEEMVRERLR